MTMYKYAITPLNASVVLETSQLICSKNQLTGFNMRATVPFNGLKFSVKILKH